MSVPHATSQPTATPGTATPAVEPLYFGPPGRRLFGCWQHPPAAARACSVLICPPIGPEYIRAHRTLRQLALRLGRLGFRTLRFDYYGCGDSAGDFTDGTLAGWRDDIAAAAGEIRNRQPHGPLLIVGLHLGANLALQAAGQRGDIDGVLLWNPVNDGRAYAAALRRWQEQSIAAGAIPQPPAHGEGPNTVEILGYAYSNRLLNEIEHFDATRCDRRPAARAFILDTNNQPQYASVQAAIEAAGCAVHLRHAPSPAVWLLEPYQAVIPHQILQVVVSWIAELYP